MGRWCLLRTPRRELIGASVNERVRSLVFIAALVPDEGETVGEVFHREKPHPEAPQLAPDDRHGFVWMPDERFGAAFGQNASPEQAAPARVHHARRWRGGVAAPGGSSRLCPVTASAA
jgi:hypothetical protein